MSERFLDLSAKMRNVRQIETPPAMMIAAHRPFSIKSRRMSVPADAHRHVLLSLMVTSRPNALDHSTDDETDMR